TEYTWYPSFDSTVGIPVNGGQNYEFVVTNPDTGTQATLVVENNTTVGAGTINLELHDTDGTPADTPTLHAGYQHLPMRVTNGTIESESGVTNFTIELVNVTSGQTVAQQSVTTLINYVGTSVTVNSTAGEGTVTFDGGNLPAYDSLNVTVDGNSSRLETQLAPTGDRTYETTVNFSQFDGDSVDVRVEVPLSETETVRFRESYLLGQDSINATDALLTGRVETEDGAPLAGDLILAGASTDYRVDTNSDGTFSMSVDPGTEYILGYYQYAGNDSSVYFGKRDGTVDIHTIAEFTATAGRTDIGTVTIPDGNVWDVTVEDESGAPIEGADAWFIDDGLTGTYIYQYGKTTSTGAFPSGYEDQNTGIEVEGTTRFDVRVPEGSQYDVAPYQYFRHITNITQDRETTVGFSSTPTVSGTVREADGDPVNGDTIFVDADEYEKRLTTSKFYTFDTFANGTVRANVPLGGQWDVEYYQFNNSSGDYFPKDGSPDMYTLSDFNSTQVTLNETLPTAHNVNVTVVDTTGNPVPNARVKVEHRAGGADTELTDFTDQQGRYHPRGTGASGIEVTGTVNVTVHTPTAAVNQSPAITDQFTVTSPVNKTYVLESVANETVSYQNVSVTPDSGAAPLNITASVTVTNTGDARAISVPLRVNDTVVTTQNVSLAANETTRLSVNYTLAEAGVYNVSLGDASPHRVTVDSPTDETTSTNTTVNISASTLA
ncbi:hypothetical protein, partial [Haloferax profundi]|uniref:hypothetical protein n=1 Tax=Haloferax profundi TaxID=1544718 RepID=UPI000AB43029